MFTECNGTHAASMTCWLCADSLPWWRAARIKAGLGAEPPNAHPNYVPVPERTPKPKPAPLYELEPCIKCGVALLRSYKPRLTGLCQHCYASRSVLIERLRRNKAASATALRERYEVSA
jgi:hypothetical protein